MSAKAFVSLSGEVPEFDPGEDAFGPGGDDRLRLSDVNKLLRRTRRRIVGAARAEDRVTFQKLLAAHLDGDLETLEIVEESWPGYEHVNVQVALNAWMAGEGRSHELLGLGNYRFRNISLADLLRVDEDGDLRPRNVSWTHLPSGPDGQQEPAVRVGLYLVTEADSRAAVLLKTGDREMEGGGVGLHIVADRPGAAAGIAADLRALTVRHNVFRGHAISFGREMFGEREAALQFHSRPTVRAEEVILPQETLAMIQRQVVGVAAHRQRLLAARQHLKRGLLLYGPPGVGKTHTVRYLISQLTDVTIVQVTGESLHLIRTACSVARTLQPAMIVVEDVDLIAEDRDRYSGENGLLFELLNEMDGLAEDADVVFLLTTNRADLLEPALAARPGRVDQAVALELPDAEARRQLFELYRGDLVLDQRRLDAVIERCDQVTASFLKELLRRAALIAADYSDDVPLSVSADQLDAALDELLDTRNAMTRVLLGGGRVES